MHESARTTACRRQFRDAPGGSSTTPFSTSSWRRSQASHPYANPKRDANWSRVLADFTGLLRRPVDLVEAWVVLVVVAGVGVTVVEVTGFTVVLVVVGGA